MKLQSPQSLPSLVLFARAPEPGRVKTRLAERLTEAGAAALYRAFLEDAARVYARPDRWRSVLCADPDPRHPLLAPIFGPAWVGAAQGGGGLDRRLPRAFRRERRRGAPAAVAVGADHPALRADRLVEAFSALAEGVEAVIIPADDGGYCAIGLAAEVPLSAAFDGIPWSTDAVLRRTVARLEEAGVRHRLLSPEYDVDRPEDLDRLRKDLAGRSPADPGFPAATARALATWDGVAEPRDSAARSAGAGSAGARRE